jgi:DNA-binding transcriptional LysR family regulator
VISETSVRCFLTLASTLSFTKTAKQVYLSQQSVSKHISSLEDDVGFKLFTRTRHYVALTKAGENFYGLFTKFAVDFADTEARTREYYNEIFNLLRVGYLEWLEISARMGDAIKRLKSSWPALRFIGERHSQYDLIELFTERRLDMIITYSEFAPKGGAIKKCKVMATPLVLLVSPENPLAIPGATFANFKGEPFIKAAGSHESRSASMGRARRQCHKLGFTPSEIIIAPNLESAYLATELGQGVLVSTMLSRMSLHSELVCYEIGETEKLQCFWREDAENPAVAAFASYLAEDADEAYAPETRGG